MQPVAHRTSSRASIAIALLLSLSFTTEARAQEEAPAPTSWGFVSARYSSGTAGFIFGGYGVGPMFAMVGMVNNPRSGYDEVLAGLGARFDLGRWTSHAVALAASRATESWYGQLYYLPSVTIGRTTAEATFQYYLPAESSGDTQFGINPVSVLFDVGHRISLGGSYQLALQSGDGPRQAAGPAIRLAIPAGALTVDLLRGVRAFNDEVRVSFKAFH
jgi:hypothetical protein